MIINNEQHFIQFKNLNEYSNISHLFTLKPFNFRKNLIADEDIKKQYEEISTILRIPNIHFLKPLQTHTNVVKCVTENNKNEIFNDVDGLITN